MSELEAAAGEWNDLPYLSIHSVTRRARDIDAALEGTFRHRDERFELAPPIDWWDEPYTGAYERGFFQNSFVFADLLLPDPRFPQVLRRLAAIFVDWLVANPREGGSHPHRYAWHDHAAAGRIVPMAYVLREGVRRGSLDRALTEALAAGVQEHADYLLADENYAAHHNHGFASDAALIVAARSLAPAPEAGRWAKVAEHRFAAVLDHMIEPEEAIHLEHSPAYHWNIHDALGRFATDDAFESLDLVGLMRRMEKSGAWLVTPDGTMPPFGDTPPGERPPASAGRVGVELSGMKVFDRAGYAVVKAGGSALFVTAAHHPTAHKHADDGSFCLYEGGRAIVLDSGHAGYEYESAEFRYGTSPAAHATICVDGFDWAKGAPAYGSGVVASAERDELFALLARNPTAVPGGGAAQRVLVYAPARFLLVIDDVEAGAEHQLVRSLPLAPDLEARPDESGNVEIAAGDSALAWLVQIPVAGAVADDVEVISGQQRPTLRGFRFLSPEDPREGCDITLSGPASRPKAYALVLGRPESDDPAALSWSESGDQVEAWVTGITCSPLEIRLGEDWLALGG